jgi:hypothetical protein
MPNHHQVGKSKLSTSPLLGLVAAARTAFRYEMLRRLNAALLTSPLAPCFDNRPSTCDLSPHSRTYPTRGRCINRDALRPNRLDPQRSWGMAFMCASVPFEQAPNHHVRRWLLLVLAIDCEHCMIMCTCTRYTVYSVARMHVCPVTFNAEIRVLERP